MIKAITPHSMMARAATADSDERGSGQPGRPSVSSLRTQPPLLLAPSLRRRVAAVTSVIDQWRGYGVTPPTTRDSAVL